MITWIHQILTQILVAVHIMAWLTFAVLLIRPIRAIWFVNESSLELFVYWVSVLNDPLYRCPHHIGKWLERSFHFCIGTGRRCIKASIQRERLWSYLCKSNTNYLKYFSISVAEELFWRVRGVLGQFSSSEPSRQSLAPAHRVEFLTHCPLLHLKRFEPQKVSVRKEINLLRWYAEF